MLLLLLESCAVYCNIICTLRDLKTIPRFPSSKTRSYRVCIPAGKDVFYSGSGAKRQIPKLPVKKHSPNILETSFRKHLSLKSVMPLVITVIISVRASCSLKVIPPFTVRLEKGTPLYY